MRGMHARFCLDNCVLCFDIRTCPSLDGIFFSLKCNDILLKKYF
jgi:hypothetical protein